MDKLTKEEVLHVAHLARIGVTEEEIERYQIQLKQLLADIDQIKEIEIEETGLLVTPVSHASVLRDDEEKEMIPFEEFKKNIPTSVGNFVEVPVMVSE